MPSISISLTDTEYKVMESVALSPSDWADNVVSERVRLATDEIVQLVVQHCLDNGVQVPATREAIVSYAFANGVVQTAADRQAAIDAAQAGA